MNGKKQTHVRVHCGNGRSFCRAYWRIENGSKPVYFHKLAAWCDVRIEEILTGAVIPANPAHNRQFGEIAQGCSEKTVTVMLEVCRSIAEVEGRAKTQETE